MSRFPTPLVLVALVLAGLGVTAAGAAEEPTPEPTPCYPGLIDKEGDTGSLAPAPAVPPSMDLRKTFFRYAKGADGKLALTANIQVTELTADPYSEVASIEWETVYTAGEDERVAGALLRPDGSVVYFDGAFFAVDGTTANGFPASATGRFLTGKDGVIEIKLNDTFAGKTLTSVYSRTRLRYTPTPHQGPTSANLDRAPEGDAFAPPFTVVECDVAGPAGGDATPTVEASPSPTQAPPGQEPGQTPPSSNPQQQPQQQGGSAPTSTSKPASTPKKKKRKLSCAKKARKIKSAKKRKAALKRCKKKKSRKKRR